MTQKKLKNIRKKKEMSQKQMANILSTGISSYCRKENGKTKIYDEEWEKMAKALGVSIQELKSEIPSEFEDNHSTFNDSSENQNILNSVIEDLQDYIHLLKEENQSLKKEIQEVKCK